MGASRECESPAAASTIWRIDALDRLIGYIRTDLDKFLAGLLVLETLRLLLGGPLLGLFKRLSLRVLLYLGLLDDRSHVDSIVCCRQTPA